MSKIILPKLIYDFAKNMNCNTAVVNVHRKEIQKWTSDI